MEEAIRQSVLSAYRENLSNQTYRDYFGLVRKRTGSYVEGHEIYLNAKNGVTERQTFEVLNDEVKAGRMHIDGLRYYVGKK